VNMRRGQLLDGVVTLRQGTSEIMCLKMLLNRSQGRAKFTIAMWLSRKG